MKKLNQFILEKLKLSKNDNEDHSDIDEIHDPTYWEVGDILCGTWSYTMTIPYFYKILKKTGKSFTIIELPKKLVSGHYNSYHFEEVPDETKEPKGKPKNVRIRNVSWDKYGVVAADKINLRKWDGKPLVGDDMD